MEAQTITKFVITVYADDLVSSGTRSSAATVMTNLEFVDVYVPECNWKR